MPKYANFAQGLTPKGRVGAGPKVKALVGPNGTRSELWFSVQHESAVVWVALGPEAAADEGIPVTKADGPQKIKGYQGAIAMLTSTEGANEKQVITFSEADGGSVTFSYEGEAAEPQAYTAETTKEEVATNLEEIKALEGNIAVTGEPGGPFTVEFKEGLKAYDASLIEADGSELEVEEEPGGSVAVTVNTKGGVPVVLIEW